MRLVLLGDSVIDNGAYVKHDEPDVAAQIRAILSGREIEMRALDGSVTRDVTANQNRGLRDDDLVVLSSGGNDALGHIDLIAAVSAGPSAVASFGDDLSPHTMVVAVLAHLHSIQKTFEADYAKLLGAVVGASRRVLCFTIYNPPIEQHGFTPEQKKATETALGLFNDTIQRQALSRGCEVLELRSLLTDPADFANAIEPSAIGGAKIAAAIKRWVVAQRT